MIKSFENIMKNLLKEEDVNIGLLTQKEEKEIKSMDQTRRELLTAKLRSIQDELFQLEDKILERIAREVGFNGYETGEYNYQDQCRKMHSDTPVDNRTLQLIRDFNNRKWSDNEYSELLKKQHEAKNLEAEQTKWLKQLYLNEILAATCKRAEKNVDTNGKPLMSAKSYNALPQKEKDRLFKAITQEEKMSDGSTVQLDKNVAGSVRMLWNEGIFTGACCSGMVEDHPFHRYEENDKFGQWKKGENMFLNPRTCRAYISLPLEGNHHELLKQVEQKAEGWGWTIDRQDVYGKQSLILHPQHTLDGLSFTQVTREADEKTQQVYDDFGLKDMEEARREAFRIVEYDHGGKISYTDRMLKSMWMKLTDNLRYIKTTIDRDTLKQNIANGKAVSLYRYDSGQLRLSPEQLAAVFDRSGITLDKDSVTNSKAFAENPKDTMFIVKAGEARLMNENEPLPPKTMIEANEPLSYLMATQVKSTAHTAEDTSSNYSMTVMIHPDARTLEQSEKFNLTVPISEWDYYKFFGGETDLNRLIANKYNDDLYRAAADAYDKGMQKEIDDIRKQQAVSHIKIRNGLDGNTYISCHVYGERQLAKRMSSNDVEYYNRRMAASDKAYNGVAPELALKYFKNEIQSSQENRQNKGIGR